MFPNTPAKNTSFILLSICLISVFITFTFISKEESDTQNNEVPSNTDTSRDHEGDTFSIVAYDKTTGQVGGAGCSCVSYTGGIDFLSDLITDGTTNSNNIVGAIHSQAAYNASTQAFARNRMLAGDTPQQIINATVAADGSSASRQYGVVGVDNPGAAGFSGASNGDYANDIQYDDSNFTISIQGNILDTSTSGGRDDILFDMREAFLNTDGNLADRLMAALQGAKRVGGDNRCQSRGNSGRTAFVQVLSPGETSPGLIYDVGDVTAAVNNFIEPIDVLQCMYDTGEGNTGFFCRQTVNTFPYTMDFETQSWEKEATCNNENSWIRTRFGTPDANTGPSGPNQGSLYAFVESSDIGTQNFNNRAVIGSPCFVLPSNRPDASVIFDYHMFGTNMGTLKLMANSGSGWVELWSESGNKGNQWFSNETVNISQYAGQTVKFRFDATTGNGALSDMAIDNIRVVEDLAVSCTTTIIPSNLISYSESFENTIGDWVQAEGDSGNWINRNSATPSPGTGPSAANDGTYFLYTEASTNGTTGEIGPNATAILESPCFDLTGNTGANFNFDYHTFGGNIGDNSNTGGKIDVEISTIEGTWTTLFTTPGNSADQWITHTIDLSSYNEPVKLRFVGTTGNDFASDLAIDNVRFSNCSNMTTYDGAGGTGWTNGAPTIITSTVISADYDTNTIGASIEACDITVTNNATLTIAADDYLLVNGNITINAGASLIVEHTGSVVQQNNNAIVTNNGTINVLVTSPVLQTRDFMVMGVPTSSELRNDVFATAFLVLDFEPNNFIPNNAVPDGGTNFADDNGDFYNTITGATPINPGEGYVVRPQDSYTDPANEAYDFIFADGTLNNGVITYEAVNKGTPFGTPNVVANPYASAISASDFMTTNGLTSLYFWEHLTPPGDGLPGSNLRFDMDDISIRNMASGMPAANDVGNAMGTAPNNVIATAQGFGIRTTGANGTTQDIVFNNSMRLTSGNTTLRRPDATIESVLLEIRDSEYAVGGFSRIAFTENASSMYDEGYDTTRLSTIVSLFSHLPDGSEQLGIQSREPLFDGIEIALGFASQIEEELSFEISINTIEGENLENTNIFLFDSVLKIEVNLTDVENYRFRSSNGHFNERFMLRFENQSLGINEISQSELSIFPNPTSGNITFKSRNNRIKKIDIFDIHGRIVLSHNENYPKETTMIVLENLNPAVYFAQIITENGELITKKIIKQ